MPRPTTRHLVGPLRALLVTVLLALVAAQAWALPVAFAHMARESADLAPLRWPLLVLAIAVLACVQVVLVCTWQLLTMVDGDQIFSDRAFRWVDGILVAIAAACLLVLVALGLLVGAEGFAGLPALLLLVVVVGAALELLVVVLRALLRQATTLRADMDEVI